MINIYIVLGFFIWIFLSNFVFAEIQEVNCSINNNFSNSCDQCFIQNQNMYLGGGVQNLSDTWNTRNLGTYIYPDKNTNPVNIRSFYTNGEIQIGPGGFKWSSNLTDGNINNGEFFRDDVGDPYIQFMPNTSGKILNSESGFFIKFANLSDNIINNGRDTPLWETQYNINYYTFNGNNVDLNLKNHKECVLNFPAWCGDGVVSHGEACDPSDPSEQGWGDLGCSNACQPINDDGGGGGGPGDDDDDNGGPGDDDDDDDGGGGGGPGDDDDDNGGGGPLIPIGSFCGDGNLNRPNDNGINEQCDFGDGDWPQWCGSPGTLNACKIIETSEPSERGIDIFPSGSILIGHSMSVLNEFGTDKVHIRNSSSSDLFIDNKLCLYKGDDLGVINGIKICTSENIGRLNINGSKKEITGLGDIYKGNTLPLTDITFGDAKLITAVEGFKESPLLSRTLNVRVAKSSVTTIGGGASMINPGKDVSDIFVLSKDLFNGSLIAPYNMNFILTSLGLNNPLSSFVKKVNFRESSYSGSVNEGTKDIKNFGGELVKMSASLEKIILSEDELYSSFDKFRGHSDVFEYNGSVKIGNGIEINGNKTFIIENGNLTINGNIDSTDSILFVVRNGNIIIDNDVSKLDGVYMSIKSDTNTGEIKGSGGHTTNRLVVNGALYGNVSDLLSKRVYIRNRGAYIDVGTNINFTSKIFSNPAPLLSRFMGEYMEVEKIAK